MAEHAGWPEPAERTGRVTLALGDAARKVVRNLSAGTRIDDSLFVAADEYGTISRLTPTGDGGWGARTDFALCDLLPLRDAKAEIDLEGLAADDGWLWAVGSHARTRAKPEKSGDRIDLHELAELRDTRARCLVARFPLVRGERGWTPVARDGDRRAGMLRQRGRGNALSRALRHDPLLRPFTRIPAKEGGVDIEGIAAAGSRIALGMRGPVVGGHALLLETTVAFRPSGRIRLARPPVTRLLAIEGLGIRDLKRCGDDLLILAGPTTALSGPCALYRWRDWAQQPPGHDREVRLHRPERIVELPFGRGTDHPEGLALWEDADGAAQVLVICDSPAEDRIADDGSIAADLFRLP